LQRDLQLALVERVKDGDHGAIYELVIPMSADFFWPHFLSLEIKRTPKSLCRMPILKAFKAIQSFRGDSKFSTWIIQITFNEARMRIRKDRKHLYDSIDDR